MKPTVFLTSFAVTIIFVISFVTYKTIYSPEVLFSHHMKSILDKTTSIEVEYEVPEDETDEGDRVEYAKVLIYRSDVISELKKVFYFSSSQIGICGCGPISMIFKGKEFEYEVRWPHLGQIEAKFGDHRMSFGLDRIKMEVLDSILKKQGVPEKVFYTTPTKRIELMQIDA